MTGSAGESEHRPISFTFDGDPNIVEQQLKGAIVIVGERRFMIIDAEGFEGINIKRKEFQPAKKEPIGTISGSPYRGRLTFPNITVQNEGLVMPRVVNELTGDGTMQRIEGPDRVARALGIQQNERTRRQVRSLGSVPRYPRRSNG